MQLLATILVHGWTHFVGVYLFLMKSRLSRAVFLNSRNVLLSQLEALDQQAQLETMLSAVCPPFMLQKGLDYLYDHLAARSALNVQSHPDAA